MMIFCIVFAVLIYLLIGYCIDMVLRDGYETPHISFIFWWACLPIIYAGIWAIIVISDIIDWVIIKLKGDYK